MKEFDNNKYTAGFSTVVDSEDFEPGLTEETVRKLSAIKNEPEWVTEFRLKAWDHLQKIKEPTWAHVNYAPIDYQALSYYSAPKFRNKEDIPQEILDTFDKLGVSVALMVKLSSPPKALYQDDQFISPQLRTSFNFLL